MTPDMCHHGTDRAVQKCQECAIEKEAEQELVRRGFEPMAVSENCRYRLFGESQSELLDKRIWFILRDLAIEVVRLRATAGDR